MKTYKINRYSLLKADHPNNIKHGGVCLHFKELLPLIRTGSLTNIKDCPVTEVNVNNEKCFFMCPYTSPSQNHDVVQGFCTNFDLLVSKIMQNVQNSVPLIKIIPQVLN